MTGPVYPRGERVWTGYYNGAGELLFILTSKETREWYFLYALEDGKFKKLGRAKSPTELESKFHVREAMHEN